MNGRLIGWQIPASALAVGFGVGVGVGAVVGAALIDQRDRAYCVSVERYDAACAQGTDMAALYVEECRRNAVLMGKHVPVPSYDRSPSRKNAR